MQSQMQQRQLLTKIREVMTAGRTTQIIAWVMMIAHRPFKNNTRIFTGEIRRLLLRFNTVTGCYGARLQQGSGSNSLKPLQDPKINKPVNPFFYLNLKTISAFIQNRRCIIAHFGVVNRWMKFKNLIYTVIRFFANFQYCFLYIYQRYFCHQ